MAWTAEAVLALAPDDLSAKAARGLMGPSQWPLLGADDASVWGECQGSGAKPYQTSVDLQGPAFRCTCPSRKFPCKHGLALMLVRASQPDRFGGGPPPAWVSEWLQGRAQKAEKKEQQQQQKAAGEAAPADPEAAARRADQRWARMANAGEELQRWLGDQVARGLGALGDAHRAEWRTMAARLVDMQVPGLAQRVQEASDLVGRGGDAPERMLHALGLLQLACDALARHADLPPAWRHELRGVLGWPLDRTDVQAEGERVRDAWWVLGQVAEERADKLTERRVWLQGERTGRRALLLDHAFAGKGFEQSWISGARHEAELAFWPGSAGLRALALEARGVSGQVSPQAAGWDDEWRALAARVAAAPWLGLHPLLLDEAVPVRQGERWTLWTPRRALPLALNDGDGWGLAAHAGGRPVTLAGEWNGRALRPMCAWNDEGLWQRGAAA